MTPDDAKKALKKVGWFVGDSFKKRSPEDQKTIIQATTALAEAGQVYEKPLKKPTKD